MMSRAEYYGLDPEQIAGAVRMYLASMYQIEMNAGKAVHYIISEEGALIVQVGPGGGQGLMDQRDKVEFAKRIKEHIAGIKAAGGICGTDT